MVSGDTSGLAPFSASQELAMMRGSDQSYAMSDEIDKSDGRLCDTQGHWPPHPAKRIEKIECLGKKKLLPFFSLTIFLFRVVQFFNPFG